MGLPAVLYMLTRYGVMLQASLNLVSVLDYNLDLKACQSWNVFSNWSIPVVMAIVEATLALRVVALWGNRRIVLIGVWSTWILASASMLCLMGLTLQGAYPIPSPDTPILGCQIDGPFNNYWAVYVPSIIFETIVAALTLWRGIHHRKILSQTPLLHVLIRDGFAYFVAVLALMLLNLLVDLLAPYPYISWFPQITVTIASVTVTRLFLNLRQVAENQRDLTNEGTLPIRSDESENTYGSTYELHSAAEGVLETGESIGLTEITTPRARRE